MTEVGESVWEGGTYNLIRVPGQWLGLDTPMSERGNQEEGRVLRPP